LSEDRPLAIVIVDDEQRARQFLPQLDELVEEGLVILDEARWCGVPRSASRSPPCAPPSPTWYPPAVEPPGTACSPRRTVARR
jgi:hypothetical protein